MNSCSSASPLAGGLAGNDARELMDRSQTAHLVIQRGQIIYANPRFAALIRRQVDELIGQADDIAIPPDLREQAREVIARSLARPPGHAEQFSLLRSDGSRFDVRIYATRVPLHGRSAVLIDVHDITEQSHALRQARWNAEMLERTEALCRSGSFEVALPDGAVTLSNGLRQLVGQPDDVPKAPLEAQGWIPPDERDFVAGIWRSAEPGEPFDFQHRVVTASGQRLVVLHRGRVEVDETGARHGIAMLQDITAQRDAEQRLQELATQDEVTGLPNRAAFLERVDSAMVAAGWDERIVSLLAIDVPRIAELRDRMGFGAGDALAMALAARLQHVLAEGETVAQLGSQEFALMVELPQPAGEATARVLARAEVVRQALEAPVQIGLTETFARCVIGIASFPGDAKHPPALLELAQTARLRATPDTPVVLYEPESNARALREMRIEAMLRQALAGQEFELHYQPQVDLSDGRVVGAEALLRWTSPALGPMSPAEFIPVAERAGLIGSLGDWVLRRACQQLAQWRAERVTPVRVGVNFSPAQLQRQDIARHIQSILHETGADPVSLGVEVTEGTVMADVAHAATALREIRALGIEVSLDDFGTGYSSLSCLRSLPIDVVKVDRSFVHDVTAAPEDVSVTRAIITMAHGLQLRVLAEGVETDGQLSLLAANRCDLIQGYRFSEALPPAQFAALLREGRRLPERFLTRARDARTLLLVDDEEHILASLKRLLRRDAYHIITATSAAEGLRRLAESEVDVIVSDQRMPGMTGVEFLRRAKELYPHTIRMVLSGYTELQSIIDAINEGAIYKFLTKPWDDARLRDHVAEAFRQKALADENRRLARQVEAANADYQALTQRLEGLLAREHAQAELVAAAAASTRAALEVLPAAVIVVDGDGTLAFANADAQQLVPGIAGELGLPAGEVLPTQVHRLFGGGDGAAPMVEIRGRQHRAFRRSLPGNGPPTSHILLLTPEPRTETP